MIISNEEFNASIGARIRAVRVWSGLKQGQFADIVGISRSYMSTIEAGKTKVGADALAGTIKAFPILNGNWLLTGEGAMLVTGETSALQGPVSSMGGQGAHVVDPLVAELADLREMARRSSQATARKLLEELHAAGAPLTRARLGTLADLGPGDVGVELAFLRRLGLVEEGPQGVVATGRPLAAYSPADGSFLALEAIHTILNEVLPAADRGDGSGRMAIVEVSVPQGTGRELTVQVWRLLKDHLNQVDHGDERVTLVVGCSVKDLP